MTARGFPDLSPIFQAADWLGIPYDPILPVLNMLYGDPDSLEVEADRLRKIQSNIGDGGELLSRNLAILKLHWSGDACAAFEGYITSVTKRLEHLTGLIDKAAWQLGETASNIRMMWASIAAEVAGVIVTILGAIVAAQASGGLSLLIAASLVFVSLGLLANTVHDRRAAFDTARREIAAARTDLDSWAAGGASSLFAGPSTDSLEWVPQ